MLLSFRARSLSYARKAVVLITGGTVLLVGVIMIVTPGPAFVVIPAGLAILAVEFAWARNLLKKTRDYVSTQVAAVRAKKKAPVNAKSGRNPPSTP